MKKIILLLAIIISGAYLINFISAISVNLNSGDILDNTTWGKISNITDKISVENGDMKINGKIYISGKLCDNNGKCLGECANADEHWDTTSSSCINNMQNCTGDITNATLAIKTWNTGSKVYGTCTLDTCADGYVVDGNNCTAASAGSVGNPGLSCLDLMENGGINTNGVYYIKPDANPAFEAYCLMDWNGGGYTIVGLGNEKLVSNSPHATDNVGNIPTFLNSITPDFMFSQARIASIPGNNLWTYAGYGDAKALITKHNTDVRYDIYGPHTGGKMYYKDMTLLTPVNRRYPTRTHGPGIMRNGADTRCGLSVNSNETTLCYSISYHVVWKSVGGGRSGSVVNPIILNGPMLLMKK